MVSELEAGWKEEGVGARAHFAALCLTARDNSMNDFVEKSQANKK